jgi:hypothetical protein
MKQLLFSLTIFFALTGTSLAQQRHIARGAEPGELYFAGAWYGTGAPPFFDTLRTALYRLTEYGKKLTIQYNYDSFYADNDKMSPGIILADATPGVLYNRQYYMKDDGYSYTALWASFDYGKNWIFREENKGYSAGINLYFAANVEGTIYRVDGGLYCSEDYGNTWQKINDNIYCVFGNDCGLDSCEVFGIHGNPPTIPWAIYYTRDWFDTYSIVPIDSQYVQFSADILRGGLPGEVYVSSRFPDWTCHVSFSADTGYTFRKVFISETYAPDDPSPIFMSDREPGVFYIIRAEFVQDQNPRGEHLKLCIHYYRDYGETLVDIYCHDIHKNYKNEVGIEEVDATEYITIFPNPTSGALHVTSDALHVTDVEVFDVYGRKQKAEGRRQNVIDLSDLSVGIYFMRITTDKGVTTKKIIKK